MSRENRRKFSASTLKREQAWSKPSPEVSTNPKDLIGITKPGISAIPASALWHLGRAMSEGKQKYGLYNWRETKVQSDIYFDAMMRHAWAWNDGQELADGPLQCHHLAHVMACAAILLDGMETSQLIDKRGRPGTLPTLLTRYTSKGE